jgi:hypothetical protein
VIGQLLIQQDHFGFYGAFFVFDLLGIVLPDGLLESAPPISLILQYTPGQRSIRANLSEPVTDQSSFCCPGRRSSCANPSDPVTNPSSCCGPGRRSSCASLLPTEASVVAATEAPILADETVQPTKSPNKAPTPTPSSQPGTCHIQWKEGMPISVIDKW